MTAGLDALAAVVLDGRDAVNAAVVHSTFWVIDSWTLCSLNYMVNIIEIPSSPTTAIILIG